MRHNDLKDYSDLELYEILQKNISHDLKELAGICSEVLRRMLIRNYIPEFSRDFMEEDIPK